MLVTALRLAAKGLRVLPCRPREKRPLTLRGVKDASTNPSTIRRWWTEEPDANIGVACGPGSNLWILDVDDGGEPALAALEREHGELPRTVEAITPNRGRHLWFTYPKHPTVIRNSVGKIAEHVDVRGEHGFCLAPPSELSPGATYRWSVDSGNKVAEAPGWLLRMTGAARPSNITAVPPAAWRALLTQGVAEGARNFSIARLSGHLLRRRVDPHVVCEFLSCFNKTKCRPPLPDAELEKIVASVCGLELKRRGHG